MPTTTTEFTARNGDRESVLERELEAARERLGEARLEVAVLRGPWNRALEAEQTEWLVFENLRTRLNILREERDEK